VTRRKSDFNEAVTLKYLYKRTETRTEVTAPTTKRFGKKIVKRGCLIAVNICKLHFKKIIKMPQMHRKMGTDTQDENTYISYLAD
jgi:hypothetical protein